MTKRLEELRKAGKVAIATGNGSDDTPWINWGDQPNWVEAKCQRFFESKYGLCAEILVSACDNEIALEARGSGDNGEDYTVTVSPGLIVNLGLYSATLADKITTADVDKSFYIGFEGWEVSKKTKNRFRMFEVVPNPVDQLATAEIVEKVAKALDADIVNDLPF